MKTFSKIISSIILIQSNLLFGPNEPSAHGPSLEQRFEQYKTALERLEVEAQTKSNFAKSLEQEKESLEASKEKLENQLKEIKAKYSEVFYQELDEEKIKKSAEKKAKKIAEEAKSKDKHRRQKQERKSIKDDRDVLEQASKYKLTQAGIAELLIKKEEKIFAKKQDLKLSELQAKINEIEKAIKDAENTIHSLEPKIKFALEARKKIIARVESFKKLDENMKLLKTFQEEQRRKNDAAFAEKCRRILSESNITNLEKWEEPIPSFAPKTIRSATIFNNSRHAKQERLEANSTSRYVVFDSNSGQYINCVILYGAAGFAMVYVAERPYGNLIYRAMYKEDSLSNFCHNHLKSLKIGHSAMFGPSFIIGVI